MRRKVIVDQDTLGPAGTNLQAVAMLLAVAQNKLNSQ